MSKQRDAPAASGVQSRDEESGQEELTAAVPQTVPTPSRRRSLARKLLHLSLDLLGAAGWTWMAIAVPLPVISEYLTVKNALVAFVTIVWVGRAIVDSFFYDR